MPNSFGTVWPAPRVGCQPSALSWALQERWRVAAEKSKAESAQRSLEEQRKVMVQQLSMEREELERAKVRPAPPSAADPTISA